MGFSRLFVMIISYFTFSSNYYANAQIESLIDTFGEQLESLMCDGLRVGGDKCSKYGIQDFIYSFDGHYANEINDASDLTQSIFDRLDKTLNERASFLLNLSYVIRSECLIHFDNLDDESDETLTDFDDLYFAGNANQDANLPNDMEYSEVHGSAVSFTSSTYRIPQSVDSDNKNIQRDAQISQLLDTTMRNIYDDHCIQSDGEHEYCTMYFGTINGVFRQFPGTQNAKGTDGSYLDYDPRFRPWYVSAATDSKDVVILLDISGSMRNHNRLDLAKEAVISVLNTLGSASFVNVVAFSDTLTLSCFETSLVAATSRNVAELVDFVDSLEHDGATNFTIAFNAAFDILQSAKHCQTVILFLTDGMGDDVTDLIKERNTVDISAVIFSFTLGDEASAAVPQKVANLTGGIYTHIDDEDENLITAMSSYYLYFAYGGSGTEAESDSIIITSPYPDFDTEVVMITMALPIYINDTYFVGVLGTDIPLSFLSDAVGDITIGRKSYSFVMNEESEVLLHPLIPNAFQLLDSDTAEYEAIFVDDVEPKEFISSVLQKMLQRQSGAIRISATVKQPAGDVVYNGYIHEDAELLYIYAGVGPSSLSIAIVIYSEENVAAPNYPSFGLQSSPSDICNVTNSTDLSACLSPFNMFHRLDLMKQCDVDWLDTAQILNGNDSANADLRYNGFYEGRLYSVQYPIFYLQSGLFEEQSAALFTDPSCESLNEFHTLTNRQGTYDPDDLPYGGFREAVSANVLNSIFVLSSLHKFWKPTFLANDSLFVSMYFGHYQGLHISYPGKPFSSSYNPQIRPWYQRAISYPDLITWTTPYMDANTQKLVIGASTVIFAPDSDYAFGVAGFDYEYTAFVEYWQSVMNDVCDESNKEYCYLIDSSAFCLYYAGMESDTEDDDISRKFFGKLEPTLMQSLLDKGFFVNETNVNFIDDTIDISYIVEPSVDFSSFASQSISFTYNNGEYSLHAVSNTNLYVIHIANYHRTNLYPSDCPNDEACSGVISPGCIETSSGTECISATVEVCTEPDTTVTADVSVPCSSISELGVCILQNDEQGDVCASNFLHGACSQGTTTKDDNMMIVLIVIGGAAVVIVVVILFVYKKFVETRDNEYGPVPVKPSAPHCEYEGTH